MKKLLISLLLLLSLTPLVRPLYLQSHAATAESTFAYIDKDTLLYSIEDASLQPITSLPRSYFVEVLDTQADYYKVSYLDIVGLVAKADVTLVDYTPKYKYASPKIALSTDVDNVNIRSSTDNSSEHLYTVSKSNYTSFIYYGALSGKEVIPTLDRWYYIRLTVDNETIYGYIYSAYVTADTIPPNIIEAEKDESSEGNANIASTNTLEGTTLYIFIGALCLPVLIIMFLLFRKKPTKPTT